MPLVIVHHNDTIDELIFPNDPDLIKFVKTIPGWMHHNNKFFIKKVNTPKLIDKLKSVNCDVLLYQMSTVEYNPFAMNEYLNMTKELAESLYDTEITSSIKDYFLLHQKFQNAIRIRRNLDAVVVELPISIFSMSVLDKLKKAYSMYTYGWVFVGEENIKSLFDTCIDNSIQIICEN